MAKEQHSTRSIAEDTGRRNVGEGLYRSADGGRSWLQVPLSFDLRGRAPWIRAA